MLHRTTRTALCGCVVHYLWDDEEPHDTRMHEPVTEDCDRLPWTLEPAERKRKGCGAHWHEDHHEHFRRLLMDDNPDAFTHEPGVGMRHKL